MFRLARVRERGRDVDAFRVVVAARLVADRDDLAALLLEELRGDRADVPEALDGHRRSLHRHAEVLQRLLGHDHAAAARRFPPAQRAAHFHRLSRDDGRHGVAGAHRERVHHPRHHPLVRVHVWRGHVRVRAEGGDNSSGIPPRQPFELADAQLRGITDHSALRAAEWQIHDGALPRHPRGERLHLLECHLHVESNPALRWPARGVVQDAVAGEHLDFPTVHHHGTGDDDLLFRMAQDLVQSRFEIEKFSGPVEA